MNQNKIQVAVVDDDGGTPGLAMAPDGSGSPSSVVTMPTTSSISPWSPRARRWTAGARPRRTIADRFFIAPPRCCRTCRWKSAARCAARCWAFPHALAAWSILADTMEAVFGAVFLFALGHASAAPRPVSTDERARALPEGGRTYESEWAHIFTFRNGQVIDFREYSDTAQVLQAFLLVPGQAA